MEGLENSETVRLWRVHKTVHQMAYDRDYIVVQSDLDMNLEEFTAKYSSASLVEQVSSLLTLL
jgi:DNA-directed RNA polymerase I, II, and III subunit RPABC1